MSVPNWKLSYEYDVWMPLASGPNTISKTLTMIIATATSSRNWLCSGRVMKGLMTPACSA